MFSFGALAVAATLCLARADAATQFYAYGTGINGLPVFYGDAVAYLGYMRPDSVAVAGNITFTFDSSTLIAAPVNATNPTTAPSTSQFYIDTAAGAFAPAGFSNTTNTTIETMGFETFGTLLVWVNDEGLLEAKWWAVPVEGQGALYTLRWNVDNTVADNAVPVVVKSIAPSS